MLEIHLLVLIAVEFFKDGMMIFYSLPAFPQFVSIHSHSVVRLKTVHDADAGRATEILESTRFVCHEYTINVNCFSSSPSN